MKHAQQEPSTNALVLVLCCCFFQMCRIFMKWKILKKKKKEWLAVSEKYVIGFNDYCAGKVFFRSTSWRKSCRRKFIATVLSGYHTLCFAEY